MSTLSSIIDRRAGKGKSAENRRKFLERVRDSVRESMPSILSKGSLKDVAKNGGEVEVKRKTVAEPSFRFGKGGDNDHVLPGNKEFVVGDRLKKPQGGSGQGQGKQAGQGESEDPFVVQITREEFLNFLFEDLELPDLARKQLAEVEQTRRRSAGFSTTGTPARLSIQRSMRMATLRRVALRGASQEQEQALRDAAEGEEDQEVRRRLEQELDELLSRSGSPFIDEMDLRFRSVVSEPQPIASATMVCIMDNSGSMGEREKTLARKFFYLLYLFLNRKYEKITLVFLHHTEVAKEVGEEEFFNTRESGGTKVSSALELFSSMVPGRIDPSKTNIYVCQCSDGDNFSVDNPRCVQLLGELLPKIQYWAYIQIEPEGAAVGDGEGLPGTLWSAYQEAASSDPRLACKRVSSDAHIYPVFRKIFEKRASTAQGGQ